MTEDNFEVKLLSDISRVANFDIHLDERLKLIISIIIERTNDDACTILLLDEESESLVLKATKGLNPSAVNQVLIPINIGIVGWTAREKKPVASSMASEDPRFEPIPETGETDYKSVLSVPILDRGSCIGVIYTQTFYQKEYDKNDIRFLAVIASQLSGIIRNAQIYEKASQNVADLKLLNEFNQEIDSTLNMGEILPYIVRKTSEFVNANAAILWLASEENLIPKAYNGVDEQLIPDMGLKIGSGVIGKIVETKSPAIIKDIDKEEDFFKIISPNSILCTPLIAKFKIIGVLCLFYYDDSSSKAKPQFTRRDLRIISAIAGQSAMAIDRAMIYSELERVNNERKGKIRELTLLYDLSVAMQSTINLNKLVRIILSCITVGDGFGFNRAMLLLVNEHSNTLQGIMGLGPDSKEEANHIWGTIPKITNIVQWLLSLEDDEPSTGVHYDRFTKELRIPIKRDATVLALTVLDGKSFNIKDAGNHPLVNKDLLSQMGCNSFATVPIIARDQVLGVILVDNCFTGKEITDVDVRSLVRFASYAGLAINNRRLFSKLKEANKEMMTIQSQLVQAEKLSALGELAAELAHELKNPLMTIGGFARRLSGKKDITIRESKQYSEIIGKEVIRTENLLNDILVHSRSITTCFSENDINKLIEDIIMFFELPLNERDIEIEKKLSPEIKPSYIDPNRMKQVIINLIHNSMDAMPEGGKITLTTEPIDGNPEKGTILCVGDNGQGVPPDILSNIFNPFFTTKDEGTGLGLSMSNKIVEAHGGKIEIENRVGKGVVFKIHIPKIIKWTSGKES